MSSYQYNQQSFEDSTIFESGPNTLMQRLGYVKQLIFSKTKLEFRLLWNKIFQREDEELGWLLNPYSPANQRTEATMLSTFGNNIDDFESSYQYGYNHVSSALGREKVTIYNRGLMKKGDRRRKRGDEKKKSLGERSLDIARYMGLGVYMTSTSFPSPFIPVSDAALYDENFFIDGSRQNVCVMTKVW